MTTSQENVVVLNCADITHVSYVDGSFHITSGQPSTLPPTIDHQGDNTWMIVVNCGRSKSSSVANSFNSAVGTTNHSWCGPYVELPSETSTDKPSELNFYFAVNVTFSGMSTPVTVYLGQGNQLHLFNNWWIGGPAVLNTYPGYSLVTYFYLAPSRKYLISCPYNTSGAESYELTNTFNFDAHN